MIAAMRRISLSLVGVPFSFGMFEVTSLPLTTTEASKLIEKAEQNSRSASHPIRSNEAEAILRVAAESSA